MDVKLEKWAPQTINFELAASKVFQSIIYEDGPGLLVLRGGEPIGKKANKSLFLDMVKAFNEGASSEESFLSRKFPKLWDLLGKLDTHHYYQCCDMKQIWKRYYGDDEDKIYSTPLSVAVTFALGYVGKFNDVHPSRKMVILCDDIEKYMRYNKESNESYLRDLAATLDEQHHILFLGATQLIWDAPPVLGDDRTIRLG